MQFKITDTLFNFSVVCDEKQAEHFNEEWGAAYIYGLTTMSLVTFWLDTCKRGEVLRFPCFSIEKLTD